MSHTFVIVKFYLGNDTICFCCGKLVCIESCRKYDLEINIVMMAWLFSYKGYLYHSTAAPSLISLLNYLLPLVTSPEIWRFESHGNCWVMFSATTFKWLGNWVGNLKFKNKLKILNIEIYSFPAHIKCDLHPSIGMWCAMQWLLRLSVLKCS